MIEYSSKTYLKDVKSYELKIFINKEDYYCTVKKIIDINEPFILNEMGQDIKLIDDNYYILEYIPSDKNYFCRLFIDDKKNIKETFYQFTNEQNIKDSIPYYEKIDVALVKTDYGEKIYSKDNKNIPKEIRNIIDNKKFKIEFNYKKYLW